MWRLVGGAGGGAAGELLGEVEAQRFEGDDCIFGGDLSVTDIGDEVLALADERAIESVALAKGEGALRGDDGAYDGSEDGGDLRLVPKAGGDDGDGEQDTEHVEEVVPAIVEGEAMGAVGGELPGFGEQGGIGQSGGGRVCGRGSAVGEALMRTSVWVTRKRYHQAGGTATGIVRSELG